jgi:hypothetical protein
MPFVDLNSKKIYGCKPGSRSYYHEEGHIIFDDSELGTRIKYYNYFFNFLVVIFLPFNLFINDIFLKFFCLINGLGVLATYIIEEIFCDLYAQKKLKAK